MKAVIKNKVGIITMYYDSINYGGILQAYALQKKIEDMGYDCYQISYKRNRKKILENLKNKTKEKNILSYFKWLLIKIKKIIYNKIGKKIISNEINKKLEIKKYKFKVFRENIKHTNVCDDSNIKQVTKNMKYLICGSDQIWKPGVICDAYTISFACNDQKKISYAASIGRNSLLTTDYKYLNNKIKDFDFISVREESDLKLLDNKYAEWVIDPTLLLKKSDWDNISEKKLIDGDYCFCYILGLNNKIVKELNNFSNANNIKLVTLPFSDGQINLFENKINSIKIYDAGPKDFISLIKYSKFVITDSFHASVFANIYKIQFLTIEREEETSMNTRIKSLLKIFNNSERFITIQKLNNFKIDNYHKTKTMYNKMRMKSELFLKKALGKIKK